MTDLTARDLAIIADALPWFARYLSSMAKRGTSAEIRRAYHERAEQALDVADKVRALHVAAVAHEWLG